MASLELPLLRSAGVYLLVPEAMGDPGRLVSLFASVIALAALGFIDDIRPLNAMPRIILQIAAAALVISTLPADLRLVPSLPWWLERTFILIGCVWFINLVNFMDGIDWMTVAEFVPITAGLGIFGLMGALPQDATVRRHCLVRRHYRICAIQPAGRASVSWRCRQPADRIDPELDARFARRQRPPCCSVVIAALLSGRRDDHTGGARHQRRSHHTGSSKPLLSARHQPVTASIRLSVSCSRSISCLLRWRQFQYGTPRPSTK